MKSVKVHDLLQRRALITRESAGAIREALLNAVATHDDVALDFSEIDAVTPSFIDEILGFIDDASLQNPGRNLRVAFLNAPTRLSSKFAAIGKAHGTRMEEGTSGAWELVKEAG